MAKLNALAAVSAALAFALPQAHAQEVVRLGNLKLAHFGAISYMQTIAPQCGLKIDLRIFPKGLDVMQAIIAGELDAGASASEAAISARANGVPIYVVAGFANGGARLVARPESGIKSVADLKGKRWASPAAASRRSCWRPSWPRPA
jgi:NitT/TauT family transport system substrate-binding protein